MVATSSTGGRSRSRSCARRRSTTRRSRTSAPSSRSSGSPAPGEPGRRRRRASSPSFGKWWLRWALQQLGMPPAPRRAIDACAAAAPLAATTDRADCRALSAAARTCSRARSRSAGKAMKSPGAPGGLPASSPESGQRSGARRGGPRRSTGPSRRRPDPEPRRARRLAGRRRSRAGGSKAFSRSSTCPFARAGPVTCRCATCPGRPTSCPRSARCARAVPGLGRAALESWIEDLLDPAERGSLPRSRQGRDR